MGKYNHITSKVARNVISTLKNSYKQLNQTNRKCDLEVGEYFDKKSNVEFDVELQVEFCLRFKDNFLIDGCVYSEMDTPQIIIKIGLDETQKWKFLSHLYPELKEIIRHEIEHLTQRGINEKSGKYCRRNNAVRQKIMFDILPSYRYYILKDEVDANIQGLYVKAKALKIPFQIVIDRYLNNLVDVGTIEEGDKKRIYKVWKKRIPKIGGIPKLN